MKRHIKQALPLLSEQVTKHSPRAQSLNGSPASQDRDGIQVHGVYSSRLAIRKADVSLFVNIGRKVQKASKFTAEWLVQAGLARQRRSSIASQGKSRVVKLNKGDSMMRNDLRNTTISVTLGIVWITDDQHEEDYALVAGESLFIEYGGETLIQAVLPASVCLSSGNH